MSYTLILAEVRRKIFDERNLDTLGLANMFDKDSVLVVPDEAYDMDESLPGGIVRAKVSEEEFLNPLTMVNILQKVFEIKGKPDAILFTASSSGMELAPYVAGHFGMPFISDVSGFNPETGLFLKSYYSDKVFRSGI